MTLDKEESIRVFNWLQFKVHEVDVDYKDIQLLDKLEPNLPTDYKGMVNSIRRKYTEQ